MVAMFKPKKKKVRLPPSACMAGSERAVGKICGWHVAILTWLEQRRWADSHASSDCRLGSSCGDEGLPGQAGTWQCVIG